MGIWSSFQEIALWWRAMQQSNGLNKHEKNITTRSKMTKSFSTVPIQVQKILLLLQL